MKKLPLVILSVLTAFLSCKKSDSAKTITDGSGLIIKAGYMCGWGAGEDSIEISQTKIKYVYSVPRESQQPKITETRDVSASEWNQIVNAVNMNDFVKLHYQTCNICVDGCDEWISINDGNVSHKIIYSKGQTIDSISNLQQKLAQLRTEFQGE